MKKWMLLSIMLGAVQLSVMAQDDDMYFGPTKANVAKQKAAYGIPQDTYYSGSSRSVDEYNRQGSSYEVLPADTGDVISFSAVEGVYPDSVGDFALTRKMQRWDGYEPSQEYWDGYNRGRSDSWGYYGWHSPWWYSSYYPWYDYGWGWYDPWYDPWYYGSWYGGWYNPWYYTGWGWGGYYNSWYYRPWYYHGWYGGWYGGGRGYASHNANWRHTSTGLIRSSGPAPGAGVVSRDGRSHTYSNRGFTGSRTARESSRTFGSSRSGVSTRTYSGNSGSSDVHSSSSSSSRSGGSFSNPIRSSSSSSASSAGSRSYSSGGGISSGGGSRSGGGRHH